jgi:hypothetical protein
MEIGPRLLPAPRREPRCKEQRATAQRSLPSGAGRSVGRQRLTRVPIFGPRRLLRRCATQFQKGE